MTVEIPVIPTPPTLERVDYPRVPHWMKKEWDTYLEREKLANRNPPWNAFLTDKHGETLSKQRYNELWADAKIAFNSLYWRRNDPTSWSKKTDLAASYFYNTITTKYPEFRLCEGNWKIHLWTTERYPDWVKNVRKAGGLQRAVPSIVTIGQKRPLPTQQNDTKRSKKPRPIKKEDIKHEIPRVQLPVTAEEPIVIEDSDEEDSIYVPKARTANVVVMSDTSGPKTSVVDLFPGAVESTTTAPSSPRSLQPPAIVTASDVTAVPHPPTLQSTMSTDIRTCPSIVTPAVSTAQALERPRTSPPVSLVQQPVSSEPEPGTTQPAVRPIRQKKMNPLSNLVVPKAVIEAPETTALPSLPQTGHVSPIAKKGRPLVPSDTLVTARNLYMQDYVKEYPDATLDEFRVAFAKLDSKRRQEI
ncbi:uncharacterized protein LACBIDRAFT_335422 [Laccaria bicolor S238N-H82]|uniref:Predicted protein n=1 Tax=Laccaria bicolor (strain S238N-H82 / ATCC MYA-4686) TaxID=486041 RepID=B0E2A6_LACBS|nr:uncharacterized protein LACBIDRAFT_335422 [Laccaria bicolor S238N-H82]EDQ99022.1 predicted protein [Laccaria bicolor S238N-H82]|eukprot:XP_001890330.1 predicted protein [Laccaria bicolor S238N-H82]